MASYTDPAHDLDFVLFFKDGVFLRHHLTTPLPLMPQMPAWWVTVNRFGSMALGYKWHGWLAVLALIPFLRKRRFLGAEMLAMIAISALIAGLPSLLDIKPWRRLYRKPSLPWNLVMVFASLAVLSWVYFSQKARSRIRCPVCNYNLTGNISGICPECGSPVPPEIRERLAVGNKNRYQKQGLSSGCLQ